MDDLVAWLGVQLDEDERLASKATAGPWRYNYRKQWHGDTGHPLFPRGPGEEYVATGPLDAPVCVAATGPADDAQAMTDAAYIAQWHPGRVLAEVEAKRALLALHAVRTSIWWPDVEACEVEVCVICSGEVGEPDNDVEAPCPTVRALALPYRDRPGWKPEWAPER